MDWDCMMRSCLCRPVPPLTTAGCAVDRGDGYATMMRRRCRAGISHLAGFSAHSGSWPAYATLRRKAAYVDEETWNSDEVLSMGDVGGLGARTDAELGEDVGDVGAGRGATDEERLGNLRVGPAGNEKVKDLFFTPGQSCPRRGRSAF